MSSIRDKHNLICEAYANLALRPTKAHRVCIFFPEHEQKPRLIWVPMKPHSLVKNEFAYALLSPDHRRVEYNTDVSECSDNQDYRDITLCVAEGCSFLGMATNKSLALATGEPKEASKGPLLVLVAQYFKADDEKFQTEGRTYSISDATPQDLPTLLKHFTRAGRAGLEARLARQRQLAASLESQFARVCFL